FRRRELGRDDDVALVLPILGVDQDVGPPVAGVLQDVLDRTDRAVVAVGRQGAHAVSCHRARYRASISISRLTRAPVFSAPRVVCSRVWGMTFTSKRVPSTALTVSDTPSTVIEPLGAIWRCSGAGASTAIRREPPSGVTDTTVPTPSTWPETMCPPISSPSRAARSRFTAEPSVQSPRVVFDRVSAETSTANQPGPVSTTVRQTPA